MSEDLRTATCQAVRLRGLEVFERPKVYLGFLADALCHAMKPNRNDTSATATRMAEQVAQAHSRCA